MRKRSTFVVSRALIGIAAILVFGVLGFGGVVQAKRGGACRDSVWGCGGATESEKSEPSEPARVRYDRLIAQARRALATLRSSSVSASAELAKDAAGQLGEAAQLVPDDYEAASLLGQLELERGRQVAAGLLLRRAEELYLHPPAAHVGLRPPAPIERSEPALALALARVQAQEGDMPGALRRYQRLFDEAAHSQRLLYRMADVLSALGHLEDATALYETACGLPRSWETPTVDVSRACLGYAVALDRGERALSSALLRKARIADRGPRAVELHDFPSGWERDYHRALLLPLGCERRTALMSYLHGATGLAPPTYIHRAEAHLQRLRDLSCGLSEPALPPRPALP